MSEYPLFPILDEEGQKEAQKLIDDFKVQLVKAADGVIRDLYTDVTVYIESDSWTNFRNKLMDGFKDYNNRKIQGEYEFKEIRQQIYKDFKDEIVKDLDQDNLQKIDALEKEIEHLRNVLSSRNY